MSTNPLADALAPDPGSVFGVLNDDDCQRMVERMDRPMTADEICDECELPRSTVYRKLERLVEANLAEKRLHAGEAATYRLTFDRVVLAVEEEADGLALNVRVEEGAETAADQLADLWSEVRAERERR
ncbi:winged helix-turn-helix domain-containing protein [Halopelagius longus]|uniref:ArsR family transcriptional regulator n=1 Tax=Halopelagius longus TaxID=1236180 RepID=A0A1H1FIL3_9EURY|nr:winged helix-turn-helix domain-containing protein [Halopelagius longus]RDI70085.1 ArsR family transcriptional regulator [Halopelagius longus]SDR00761.1 MarR family protein [Halopelagius longus]